MEVQLPEKQGRLIKKSVIQFGRNQFSAFNEFVQTDVSLGVTGDRPGYATQPDVPGVGEERVLGTEAVALVRRVAEVDFGEVLGISRVNRENAVVAAHAGGLDRKIL